jgi:Na+-driven multidrug efflux pump
MVTYAAVPIGGSLLIRVVSAYGAPAVAAAGVTTRMQALVLIVPLAMGAALGPHVASSLGAQQPERAQQGVRYGMRFALIFGLIAWAVLAAASTPLSHLFFKDAEAGALFATSLAVLGASYAPGGFVIVLGSAFNAAEQPMRAATLMFLRGIGAGIPLALVGSSIFGFRGVFGGVAAGALLTAGLALVWLRSSSMGRTHEPSASRS